jgi:hypothetical protein
MEMINSLNRAESVMSCEGLFLWGTRLLWSTTAWRQDCSGYRHPKIETRPSIRERHKSESDR